MERGKKIRLSLIIFVLVVAFLSFFVSSYYFFSPIGRQVMDVRFEIADYGGFDANKTALTFGAITPGGNSFRSLSIRNEYNFPIKVKILVSEEIKPFLKISREEILLPGENRSIGVTVYAPENAEFRKYEGKILFEYWKK